MLANVVTNGEIAVSLGHHSTTKGEIVTLWFWDDANSNLVKDVDETYTSIAIRPQGHEVMYEGSPSISAFDEDRNGLLDWWEAQTGLAALSGSHKETDDNDHDGLINLHEYWAGTDPLTPDGSNTLLSVCARSIDDRLAGPFSEERKMRFLDYYVNGSNLSFVANGQFWARNVDLSCASMWNDAEHDMWGGACQKWHKAGTAISRRHIICAYHYGMPIGTCIYFQGGTSGLVCRQIAGNRSIGNDILISVLDEELPEDIIPAKLLPSDYYEYIRTGKGLPVATLNQEEKLVVADLSGLSSYESRTHLTSATMPSDFLRQSYYESVISGDSGNPRFLAVGEEVVLLQTMWMGGAGAGCFVSHFMREIQQAMDVLAPGYSLTILDTSGFMKLPEGRR